MKKLIISSLVVSSFLFGATSESQNIIKGSAGGKDIVSEEQMSFIQKEKDKLYSDEILFNFILANENIVTKPYVVTEHTMEKSPLINLLKEEEQKPVAEDTQEVETITVTGYCNVSEDIHIGKQKASAYLKCNTNIGYLDIFGNLVPINEEATLIFDPKYIEYKNTRFNVEKGSLTTNEARTSYNIATYVNDRKLSEIALENTISTADTIHQSTHAYLQQLEKSQTETSTEFISAGDNLVATQNTNTEEPDIGTYAIKAGIDIVAELAKTTAEVFKKDLPYLYEVLKNTKIFIDLKVNKNGEVVK